MRKIISCIQHRLQPALSWSLGRSLCEIKQLIRAAQKLRFNADLATEAESAAYRAIALAHSEAKQNENFVLSASRLCHFWWYNLSRTQEKIHEEIGLGWKKAQRI